MSHISATTATTTFTLHSEEDFHHHNSIQVQKMSGSEMMMSQGDVMSGNNGYYQSAGSLELKSHNHSDGFRGQTMSSHLNSPHASEYQIYGVTNSPNRYSIDRELDHSAQAIYDNNNKNTNSPLTSKSDCDKVYERPKSELKFLIQNSQIDRDRSIHSAEAQKLAGKNQDTAEPIYGHVRTSTTFSPKPGNSLQSFQNGKPSSGLHVSHTSQIDSTVLSTTMPVNVKTLLLHGITGPDVIRQWLSSIRCEEYLRNFVENGYDMQIIMRMTPQDLTAIGCKSPSIRRKLLSEIKKLNLDDDIPDSRPDSLETWLKLLKLSDYFARLCDEGYNTIEKVCYLTWEDLEEIGINKLGHQKRLLLGIERLKKLEKHNEDAQNDYSIYDVHPNHRISLNQTNLSDGQSKRLSTLGRATIRSGFFQSRSTNNMGNRGLPVATVIPALKNVNSSLASLDISGKDASGSLSSDGSANTTTNASIYGNKRLSLAGPNGTTRNQSTSPQSANEMENSFKLSEFVPTIKRTAPPLPPTRTNSLKIPQGQSIPMAESKCADKQQNCESHLTNYAAPTTLSTNSFLRAPRLGNLTATTNKMLTLGGHLAHLTDGQQGTMRYLHPVREAPTPAHLPMGPVHPSEPPPAPPAPLPAEATEDELSIMESRSMLQSPPTVSPALGPMGIIALDQSSIVHQLASADEFPPPPPSSS